MLVLLHIPTFIILIPMLIVGLLNIPIVLYQWLISFVKLPCVHQTLIKFPLNTSVAITNVNYVLCTVST